MKREPQVIEKTPEVRAMHNTLIYNRFTAFSSSTFTGYMTFQGRFAKKGSFSLLQHRFASKEYRPAEKPGAD